MRCSMLPIVSKCRGSARLNSYGSEASRKGTAAHDAFRQKVVNGGRVDIESLRTRYGLSDDEVKEIVYALNNITLNIPDGSIVLADDTKIEDPISGLAGTPDLAIYKDKVITVIDWKSGWGEVEDPKHNNQLIGYGILALHWATQMHDHEVAFVDLIVVQPRLNLVKTARVTPAWLIERRDDIVTIVREAGDKDAEFTTGPWCASCFRSMSCPAFAGQVVDLAALVPPKEAKKDVGPALSRLLPIAKAAATIARKVEDLAKVYVDQHGELDLGKGQKYVKVIGTKKVIDPAVAIPILEKHLGPDGLKAITASKSKIEGVAREKQRGLASEVIKALQDGGAFKEEMTETYRIQKGG